VSRHVICPIGELPPGGRKIVEVHGRSIGIFNVQGAFYALRNRCPHKAAPLCQGQLTGLITGPEPYRYEVERQGEIVKCPWHGWEFDVTTGRSVFSPHRVRVKRYDVTVEHEYVEDVDDPSIETYPVSVEREMIVLHIDRV
jgi:nitrite reductase (NADH) small subunit